MSKKNGTNRAWCGGIFLFWRYGVSRTTLVHAFHPGISPHPTPERGSTMKKLSLHLDDLTVESFDTSAPVPARGTVQGHDHSDPSACDNSGFCTCYGQPCSGYTEHCASGDEPH